MSMHSIQPPPIETGSPADRYLDRGQGQDNSGRFLSKSDRPLAAMILCGAASILSFVISAVLVAVVYVQADKISRQQQAIEYLAVEIAGQDAMNDEQMEWLRMLEKRTQAR